MYSRVLSLLVLVSLTGFIQFPEQRQTNKSNAVELELPSFAIFGLSVAKDRTLGGDILDPKVRNSFIEEIRKERGRSKDKDHNNYWIIPVVFFQARNLFSKNSWKSEEIKQGKEVADFLAEVALRPDLKIDGSEESAFRYGLINLRNWFMSLCQDNKKLAKMIFTLDNGPYFGSEIDSKSVGRMVELDSIRIPSRQSRFVLMTKEGDSIPTAGIIDDENSVRWLTKLSGVSARDRLQLRKVNDIYSYGYVLSLAINSETREKRCSIYLDESLHLRFYFLSW